MMAVKSMACRASRCAVWIAEAVNAVESADHIGGRAAAGDQDHSLVAIGGFASVRGSPSFAGKLRPVEEAAADLDDRELDRVMPDHLPGAGRFGNRARDRIGAETVPPRV